MADTDYSPVTNTTTKKPAHGNGNANDSSEQLAWTNDQGGKDYQLVEGPSFGRTLPTIL